MAVYLDAVWILNWLFDSLLLLLSAILLKQKFKWWRTVLGGFIGSLIVWLYVTPYAHLIDFLAVKLLFSILMVVTAFGFHNLRFFCRRLVTLYAITFLMGGILIGSHFLFSFKASHLFTGIETATALYGDPISWIFVIIGYPLAWHFAKFHFNLLEVTKWKKEQQISALCQLNDITMNLISLIDTGNQLQDPISGAPVAIISLKEWEGQFPPSVLNIIRDGVVATSYDDIPEQWQGKMRIVPCKVVGQEHQLLIAFKPDHFSITVANQSILVKKCLVSFSVETLSPDGSFNSIVHPKMIPSVQELSAS